MSSEFLKQVVEERTKNEAKTAKLRSRIEELEWYYKHQTRVSNAKLKARVAKLKQAIYQLKKESESKKNRKFQTRCIQIAKEILNKKPITEYHLPFLN